jgi:hypothetical protein
MSMMASSTPVATVLHSSNGHGDDTMPVAIVSVYKKLDTVPPSSSDRAQCESRLFACTVVKKLKKVERDFDFIFLGLTLESKSLSLFKFFCYLDVYLKLYLRLKFLGLHNHFFS